MKPIDYGSPGGPYSNDNVGKQLPTLDIRSKSSNEQCIINIVTSIDIVLLSIFLS